MDPVIGVERFLEVRAQYPEGYAIWHARIATHGSKCVENCHPFPVGNDPLSYFAHNGMLPMAEEKDDDRSDSRIFAEETLRDLGGVKVLDSPRVFELLSSWSSYNKWAVLTLNPEANYNLYIINEDKGQWVDGIWWSNKNHIPAKVYGGYQERREPEWYAVREWNKDLVKHVLVEPWKENYESGYTYEFKAKAYRPIDYTPPAPKVGTAPVIPINKNSGKGVIRNWDEMSEEDWKDWQDNQWNNSWSSDGDLSVFFEEDDESILELCPLCEKESDLSIDEDFCLHCGSCFACLMSFNDCLCYKRSNWSSRPDRVDRWLERQEEKERLDKLQEEADKGSTLATLEIETMQAQSQGSTLALL